MFPRVLYVDNQRALELNWFGLGALQMRHRSGGVRRAHPIQKRVFMEVVQAFEASGQPLHPSNPRCSAMMKEFAEMLEKPPNSVLWQAMYRADLNDVGKSYAEGQSGNG
jgi:hypothetical protein